ncbi:unnamed protein product [Acanthoscelides obtectus]|uniref:Uncharacterized protein n=1 Tax=Acanthoscelides obtectus TaxID=200917 RepID=A0A9P0LGU2_ACAOB|nr:unnamed protein product [Acanthoscelides obtectus]CAK1627330.1 hypothetical protein AOBTE_LOCUS4523 [Acanthoscelides obtectus]
MTICSKAQAIQLTGGVSLCVHQNSNVCLSQGIRIRIFITIRDNDGTRCLLSPLETT